MDLQHRQHEQREERAVVQREKRGAARAGKFFALRQKCCRREHEPVARQKSRAEPEVFVRRSPAPAVLMEKPPERIAGIAGRQAGERKAGPAVAHEKHHRGDGEHQI